MEICRKYPKFEADQVLTAEQLNKLFGYLDTQNRWTRKCFIGAGIACGLETEVDESSQSVTISSGCGLTTLGYLVHVPELYCTHYNEYTDPIQYPYFRQSDSQVKLWQLLPENTFDSEDPDNLPIDVDFLTDKVALLYLEVQDVDLDTCTGSDCDEKGTEVNLCVRVLIIEESVLQSLIAREKGSKVDDMYQMYQNKYQLPQLDIGRLHWLGCDDNLLELEDVQLSYSYLLSQGIIDNLKKSLTLAYDTYAPMLSDEHIFNPFVTWQPILNHPLGIQYFYDHIKDLLAAYDEFVRCAFDVFVCCCIPDQGFKKHLTMGKLIKTKKCKPASYRHYFITAMEPTSGENQIRKVKSLFNRLVLLTRAFKVPDLKSSLLKVTPSDEKNTPLGMRAIPYYYDLTAYPELKTEWNFDLKERCLSKSVLSYQDNDSVPICESEKQSSRLFNEEAGKRNLFFGGKSKRGIRNAYRGLSTFLDSHVNGTLDIKGVSDYSLLNTLINKNVQSKGLLQSHMPLDADLINYPFYRVEGHLGKNYHEVAEELQTWIKCYNLPIKLMGLKVGSEFDDIDLELDCRFEDLELIYLSQREKISCYFKQTTALVRSIKFDAPIDDLEESPVSKVTGIFVDGRTSSPLTGVYYGIQKLRLVGETDATGAMEFSDLATGTYTLETYLKGYGSKSFPISIKQGKSLKLGNIELHQEALLDEKEVFFKDKTAEEEVARAAKEFSSGSRYDANTRFGFKETEETNFGFVSKDSSNKDFTSKGFATKDNANLFLGDSVSYRYNDLAGKLAADARYLNTGSATNIEFKENIEFATSGYAQEVSKESRYEIGTIYEDFEISESKDILNSAKLYLYRNFANTNVKETDDILDKVYQPLQIVSTISTLLKELEKPLLQFDKVYFSAKYEQLLSQVEKFKDIITGDKYGELFLQEDKDNIIRYFNLLQQENCFNQFQSLMEAYADRVKKIQILHLLSAYSCKNPGMVHAGGTWSGGTFFLIYDETRRVVLDFALPYICCSDCPPIQFCTGIPVIFKLPKTSYCKNDSQSYKFITNYPGGQVIGSGVTKDETTGDYYFKPSEEDVSAGEIEFTYFIDEAKYDFAVSVADPQVSIAYNLIEVDDDAQTAKVQFFSEPREATEYLWDFGDETTSADGAPVKDYDLSASTEFTVNLRAKQGDCFAESTYTLTFEICNAAFTYTEIERSLNSITYQFTHPQASLERNWDMGDDNTIENLDTFSYTYERLEEARDVAVTLSMSQETCDDTHTETITIPAREEVTIFMNSYEHCSNGVMEKVVFDPKNGAYSGNGLILVDGEVYFNPAHPDVVIGENEITYEFEGVEASRTVTVDSIDEEFSYDIRAIDGDKMSAEVQFSSPEELDSYNYDLGDGNTSELASFTHTYELQEQVEFEVSVTLQKGACSVTQSASLDLTPCSAEFTFEEIANDGETITIEYTVLETGADEYHLEDELGSFRTASNQFQRRYSLGDENREMSVVMHLTKSPCTDSFSSLVIIPAQVPLSLSIEQTQFVICDKNSYEVTVTSGDPSGEATGPGVRMEDNGIFFIPSAANTSGDVTITYKTANRSTNLTVNIKQPTPSFEIKSINKVSEGNYDVSLINNSVDFNNSLWVFNPGGSSTEDEPVFRLTGVKPNQIIVMSLAVDWDEQCQSTTPETTIRIPADIIDDNELKIDINRYFEIMEQLSGRQEFAKVFPSDHSVIKDFGAYLERLQGELSDEAIDKDYRSGERNEAINKVYQPMINTTLEHLSNIAIEVDADTAQSGYPMLRTQTMLFLELISILDNDLQESDPLVSSFETINKAMQTLLEFGLKLNPENQTEEFISKAIENNAHKDLTVKLIDQLRQLVA